jgi:hypothetical protein
MKLRAFILPFLLISQSLFAGDSIDLLREVDRLQNSLDKRWQKLEALQADERWLDRHTSLGLPGPVYKEGWTNPRVQREIVHMARPNTFDTAYQSPTGPRLWWTLDQTTIGPSLLNQAATLAGNILFHMHVFPFAQGGYNGEKQFVHGRMALDYADALMLPPSRLNKLPLTHESLGDMKIGEFYTTQSTTGFYLRAGGGILPLLGIELPLHLNIGPRVRLHTHSTFQVTLAKDSDDHVLVALERAQINGSGQSFGLGFFFEDFMRAPVVVGIDSPNGFSPLQAVIRQDKRTSGTIAYRINLADEYAEAAYQSFLRGDLTLLQDLAKEEGSGVQELFVREGEEVIHSSHFSFNLLFWRMAWHNQTRRGTFQTTINSDQVYRYHEYEIQRERQNRFFSTRRSEKRAFLTQIPEIGSSFVVDSEIRLRMSRANGRDIHELLDMLFEWGNVFRLPIEADSTRSYGDVEIVIHTHFTPSAIEEFLESTEYDIKTALANAFDFFDSHMLLDSRLQNRYIRGGRDEHEEDRRRSEIRRATAIYRVFERILSEKNRQKQAEELVKLLGDRSRGQYAHNVLLQLIDHRKLIIQGQIRGESLL